MFSPGGKKNDGKTNDGKEDKDKESKGYVQKSMGWIIAVICVGVVIVF